MNELQKELISSLERFRTQKIDPIMEHDDANEVFNLELYRELGALGFTGVTISEEFGGAGLSYSDYCYVLEEIA